MSVFEKIKRSVMTSIEPELKKINEHNLKVGEENKKQLTKQIDILMDQCRIWEKGIQDQLNDMKKHIGMDQEDNNDKESMERSSTTEESYYERVTQEES